ncbi:MAG TPA: hypothetical protein VFA79_00170 [Myxococcales bacterium]|nr:hypothetical protein [Myxococcales bacterium]
MLALVVAAAVFLPSSADAVLSVEDASGVRALLEKAGGYAPSLSPQSIGATLRDRVGIDLLGDSTAWGLAPRGAQLLVFGRDAVGLSAPVRDLKAARRQMTAWLAQNERRAARIGRGRLLTASGRGAKALLAAMGRAAPLPPDLAARARGPVWLWARLEEPLRAVVLAVDASGIGLVARGLATASGPLLAGPAPAGCADTVACLRAGVAEAGRAAIAVALARLGAAPQPELSAASRVEERVDAIDVRGLSDRGSLARALRITAVFGGTASAGPALDARIDLAEVDAALRTITPLDAIRGGFAAGAYAVHAVYGELLGNAGPLTLTGSPSRGNAAEIDIRLPLR